VKRLSEIRHREEVNVLAKEVLHAVGRRKSSVARVFLMEGNGKITVNGKNLREYMKRDSLALLVKQPLETTQTISKYDIKASVKGGGIAGQAGALRLGIARAILMHDESHKKVLKAGGFLTRDPREKERKKYGQPGARKKFQFSKR
jgi:small subunit ribosomal protein S9